MDKHLSLKYHVLDVFSSQRYSGNPLAVVHVDQELPVGVYADIAKEFNYSETSFVTYTEYENVLKVRSFTPAGIEVGGAGHNLLGAVALIVQTQAANFSGAAAPIVIMQDSPMRIVLDGNTVGMVQQKAIIGAHVPRKPLAEALGLSKDDLYPGELEPVMVATEVNHLMVPLRDSDALDRAAADKGLLAGLSAEFGFEGVYCFVLSEKGAPYVAHSRFFNPGIGIIEDPATGSAAGPLTGFLHHHGIIRMDTEYEVLQGEQMGRPSVLRCKVTDEGIVISGTAIIVMEGTLYYDRGDLE